ncbi:hypothetical protein GmHk_11G030857 [Glycine max]|nr:hypothetical protein GmHk_11G030857 [Glycine max]
MPKRHTPEYPVNTFIPHLHQPKLISVTPVFGNPFASRSMKVSEFQCTKRRRNPKDGLTFRSLLLNGSTWPAAMVWQIFCQLP